MYVEVQPSPAILSPLGLVGVHVKLIATGETIVIHSGYVTTACAAFGILAACSSYVPAAYAALCALAIVPSASPAAVGGACIQERKKRASLADFMHVVHIYWVNSLYMCAT